MPYAFDNYLYYVYYYSNDQDSGVQTPATPRKGKMNEFQKCNVKG